MGQKRKADDRIRTNDLLITNQLLYQLSYASTNKRASLKRSEILFHPKIKINTNQ
jgi:hypothetical protein